MWIFKHGSERKHSGDSVRCNSNYSSGNLKILGATELLEELEKANTALAEMLATCQDKAKLFTTSVNDISNALNKKKLIAEASIFAIQEHSSESFRGISAQIEAADHEYITAVETANTAWSGVMSTLQEFPRQNLCAEEISNHCESFRQLFQHEMEQRNQLMETLKSASDGLVANLLQSSEQITAKRRLSPPVQLDTDTTEDSEKLARQLPSIKEPGSVELGTFSSQDLHPSSVV